MAKMPKMPKIKKPNRHGLGSLFCPLTSCMKLHAKSMYLPFSVMPAEAGIVNDVAGFITHHNGFNNIIIFVNNQSGKERFGHGGIH